MQMQLKDFVIQELKEYKINKEILTHLENEEIGIEATTISETPHSITNKFSSITETMAFWSKDSYLIEKSVKRVESWLRLLNDIERFVITRFFLEEYTYRRITEAWHKQEGDYYSHDFWKLRKKQALNRIVDFYEKFYIKKLPP